VQVQGYSLSLQLKYVLQIFWKFSNNQAEYEALVHGLRLTASLGIKWLLVYGNSAVVTVDG
jgi:ribonuclease HI